MIIEGIDGIALTAIPIQTKNIKGIIDLYSKRNYVNPSLGKPMAKDYSSNKTIGEFYFFNSDFPNETELCEIENKSQLLEKYGENLILEYIPNENDLKLDKDGKNIYILYDFETETRIYKKYPNAINLLAKQDGDIKWGVCIVKKFEKDDLDETSKNYILFSKAIGTWENDDNVFIFSKTENLKKDEEIIFKDFSFKIRDIYKYEGIENG